MTGRTQRHSYGWVMAVACGWAAAARADYRAFAHISPHFTQPEGQLEVEGWVSAESGALAQAGSTTLYEHRLEVEYGLTDRADVSLYQVFQQPASDAFRFDSVRFEGRYQLTRKFEAPVDVLAYAEFERPADLQAPNELELKLVATRDLGSFYVQTNWIAEAKLATGDRFGYWLGAYLGAGYEVVPSLRLGVELLADWVSEFQGPSAQRGRMLHLGPSLALARGRVWCVLSPAFGVAGTSTAPELGRDLRLRLIVGVEL